MSNAKKSRKTIEWETLEISSRKLVTKRRFHANMGTKKDRKDIDLTEVSESRSIVSDSLQPLGLYSPWDSPGQNTGVGSLSLLQGIFPTQGSNPGLPHCRRIFYQLSNKVSRRY